MHKRGFCFPFSAISLKLSCTQLPPSVTLMIPHRTPIERYLFDICVTLDILRLKLRPRTGETWLGLHS